MSKKIVIVGPPGVGKTTLRKIFFEGENSTKLLEYALDPTFGKESINLRMKEDVGIFDLAGQENYRWFETEEKSIFFNTKILLSVLDANAMTINEIIEFIKKVKDLRNEITQESTIYSLIHKIDLVDNRKLIDLKEKLQETFQNEKLMKISFTSITKEYFTQTFITFIDILTHCLEPNKEFEKERSNLLNETLKFVHFLTKEKFLTEKELKGRLNVTDDTYDKILENLVRNEHLQVSNTNDEEILSLSEKGKSFFDRILNQLLLESVFESKNRIQISKIEHLHKIDPFIGFFIANKDGLTLVSVELFDGAFKLFLRGEVGGENSSFDVQLIPMFISALEKFSSEINIKDLSGFNLMGSNLKMQIFTFKDYTVTVFTNPNINMLSVKNKIENFFFEMFEKYKEDFIEFTQTGLISGFVKLEQVGRKWLEELNKSYNHMIVNLEFYDVEHAKNLYSELNEIQRIIREDFTHSLEKVKNLKFNLMRSILQENFDEIKALAKETNQLRYKFAS